VLAFTNTMFPPHFAGTNLTIQSGVVGTSPMHFQWYEGNQPMLGYTNSILTLASNYSAGPFYAVVSNLYGTATSRVITVKIMFAPAVLQTWETNGAMFTDTKMAPDNSLYTLRLLNGTQPPEPTAVARHNSSLEPEWIVAVRGSTAFARSLAVDPQTNVYVLGDFTTGFKFGNTFLATNLASRKAFLARLSPTGNVEVLRGFAAPPTNQAVKVVYRGDHLWTGLDSFGRRTNDQGQVTTLT